MDEGRLSASKVEDGRGMRGMSERWNKQREGYQSFIPFIIKQKRSSTLFIENMARVPKGQQQFFCQNLFFVSVRYHDTNSHITSTGLLMYTCCGSVGAMVPIPEIEKSL